MRGKHIKACGDSGDSEMCEGKQHSSCVDVGYEAMHVWWASRRCVAFCECMCIFRGKFSLVGMINKGADWHEAEDMRDGDNDMCACLLVKVGWVW